MVNQGKPEKKTKAEPHVLPANPPLEWSVTSDRDPKSVYYVVLSEKRGDTCTCPDHRCRVKSLRMQGFKTARCKHCDAARRHALTWLLNAFEDHYTKNGMLNDDTLDQHK